MKFVDCEDFYLTARIAELEKDGHEIVSIVVTRYTFISDESVDSSEWRVFYR